MKEIDWSKAEVVDPKKFKDMKIEMASNDLIREYQIEVNKVLAILGSPEGLVTDESTLREFLTDENSLEQISKDIGFKVYASDPICYLAYCLTVWWKEECDKAEAIKVTRGESAIPKGDYCYGEHGPCPYWDNFGDLGLHEQYCGYCWFMGQGDWQIELDMTLTCDSTGESKKGTDLPFPVSLLWDQCKACGINEYSKEENEQMQAEFFEAQNRK